MRPSIDALRSLVVVSAILSILAFGLPDARAQDDESDGENTQKAKDGSESSGPETSPCSNPRWAELPEQHQVDGDLPTQYQNEGEAEGSESDADAEAEGESSESSATDEDEGAEN